MGKKVSITRQWKGFWNVSVISNIFYMKNILLFRSNIDLKPKSLEKNDFALEYNFHCMDLNQWVLIITKVRVLFSLQVGIIPLIMSPYGPNTWFPIIIALKETARPYLTTTRHYIITDHNKHQRQWTPKLHNNIKEYCQLLARMLKKITKLSPVYEKTLATTGHFCDSI